MSKAKKYVPFILAGVATPVLYTLGKKLFGMDTPNMPTLLRMSAKGKAHLESIEARRYVAYGDKGSGKGYPTIGVGHKILPGESYLLHKTLTDSEIDALLDKDLLKAEGIVRSKIKVPVKQGLFDALVSFAFNTGTVSDAIANAINTNNLGSLPAIWQKSYVTSGGEYMRGLAIRRQKEVNLFA